jgi:hypothetical protein
MNSKPKTDGYTPYRSSATALEQRDSSARLANPTRPGLKSKPAISTRNTNTNSANQTLGKSPNLKRPPSTTNPGSQKNTVKFSDTSSRHSDSRQGQSKGNQSTSHGAPTPDLQIEIEQASSHDSDIAKSKAAKVADNEYRAMLSDWQTDVLKAYTHQNNIQNGAKEE